MERTLALIMKKVEGLMMDMLMEVMTRVVDMMMEAMIMEMVKALMMEEGILTLEISGIDCC